jgi:hypothetical protein
MAAFYSGVFVIEDWVGQQQITNDWLNNQDIDF